MKKLLSVFALSATLLVGCAGATNNNGIKESAFDGLRNETQQVAVRAGQIGSDATGAHSQTYVQYGKNDSNEYVVRFATAVKGEISSLSYSRAAVGELEAATFDVTIVYRGIEAGDSVYYYDGTDLTTDETYAGNYYWACYTIAYSSSKHFATEIDVTFAIDGIDVNEKKSSLAEICTDCEVVGHKWEREGTLKATSLTKGSNIKVCGVCGHEEITELDYDSTNVASLVSSGQDAEVNNVDIVRGLKGDAQVKFSFLNKTPAANGDWAVGRTILMVEDEGKFVPGTSHFYGKGLPAPLTAGANYNNNDLIYNYGWSGETGVGTWFSGKYTDHAQDMTVDVTVTRLDDFVVVKVIGHCNSHCDEINENTFTYRINHDQGLNVVLGTTFAEVTLLSASLDITLNSSEETLDNSITVSPNDAVEEQVVHTHNFDQSLTNQKVTFSFHEGNSLAKDDNQWGHWRGYLWRTDKVDENGNVKTPYPDATNSTNGTVLTRLTPTRDHYSDWNEMTRKWNLEGGETGSYSAGAFSGFKSTDPDFVDNFGELMDDCDVTITWVKIDRYIFMHTVYNSNKYENTTAYRYFAGILPTNVPTAFTLCQEKSTITLNSVKVEQF